MKKVKKLTTIKISKSNEIVKSEVVYNENQDIILHINFDDFGNIETKIEFEFDENKNCIKEINYYDEESVSESITNIYNENNKIVKSVTEYADGSTSIKTVAVNSAQSEQIIETHDEDGLLEAKEVNFYKDGLLVKHLIYDEDNKLVNEVMNEFDEKQNLIKRVEKNYFEKTEFSTNFEYNEKQNLVKYQKTTAKGIVVEKLLISYDEHYRIIQQKYSDGITYKYIFDDENKTKTEERYDQQGFLRLQIVSDISDGETIQFEDYMAYRVEYKYEYFE
ncbi:MAG: hypothetical protein A2046_02400 [Bacteroidetes bacterium GWA2_30_7]|nr:MAG: hypothetical protein A2046_02400 [Bacteroidetes bacterium GWA2_30_7]